MVQNRQNLKKSPNLRKNRLILKESEILRESDRKLKKPARGGLLFGLNLAALAPALAVHRQTWRNGSNKAGYNRLALVSVALPKPLNGIYPSLLRAYESMRVYPSLSLPYLFNSQVVCIDGVAIIARKNRVCR